MEVLRFFEQHLLPSLEKNDPDQRQFSFMNAAYQHFVASHPIEG
jgi:hypothetical protein